MSGGALFLIALVAGFVPQFRQRQVATADTKELAIPTVAVVSPTVTTPHSGLNLPAEVKPWQEASIFARVNGYLKDWLVDIGAHVQKDQLLAEIDTPDLDQQLAQAHSQAVLAKRNLEQAKSTNTKWQDLYKAGCCLSTRCGEHRHFTGHEPGQHRSVCRQSSFSRTGSCL